jgi:hypothetical protein
MIRPYAAMLHRPELARAAADLGAVVRFTPACLTTAGSWPS